MYQSAYTGLKPLHRNYTYMGGFCAFWYLPIEDIAVYPRINAATQFLIDEPLLKPGKKWFGPIEVPKNKLGFTEDFEKTKAGHYYKTKLEGLHIGDSAVSRVNLENMPYHRYLVVGKVRAGGFYKLVGTLESPCRFQPTYKTGDGPADTAATQFVFYTEHINKAYVLPQFSGDAIGSGPGNDDNGETDICMNNKEVIPFYGVPAVNIPWTPIRQSRFGSFPVVEVWIQEPGELPFLSHGGSIEVDAPPPAFTELNVRMGGSPSGFIVIM